MQNIKMETVSLNFFYGAKQALKNISLQFPEKRVTALIGPSGCGIEHVSALPEPYE